MSRIIVKGLPTYLSDVRLRDHFAQRGAVTDVKLMKRPDGTSRRFGFVGYRSEEEARAALEYFNRTFIDTSRITVELAKKIGDDELKQREEKRKELKRKAEQSTVEESQQATKATSKKTSGAEEEPAAKKSKSKDKGVSFEEFMAVMAPKSKRKTWQNEEAAPQQTLEDIIGSAPAEHQAKSKKDKKKASSDEASITPSGQTAGVNPDAGQDSGDEDMEKDAAVMDEGLTDLEYMQRRMRRRIAVEEEQQEKAFEQSDDEADAVDDQTSEEEDDLEQKAQEAQRLERERIEAEEQAKKDQQIVDEIMESGRLFIRNLPFSATEDELEEFFQAFGSVSQAHIPLDKETKGSKGIAFVSFEDPVDALAAYRAKDGSTFQGRLLHLIPAVNKKPPTAEGSKSLKQAKLDKRKAEAGKDFNWSMLYMNSDAVASSIADRLGVSKSDILNPQDAPTDNAAVRLALAETRIIQETKEFLANEGIDIEAFDRKERSETTMLVKNIPYGTTVDEVQQLFAQHGQVGRVLIPPTGTIAVVDMPVVGEARVAFRSLAYKRFKSSILYLEKAPAGVLNPDVAEDGAAQSKQAPLVGKEAPKPSSASVVLGGGMGSEADAEPAATLFVKNLNFSTTDDRLGQVFAGLSDFAFARIQTKADPKRPGARLSMGYGFVGFKNVEAAQQAQKAMEGHVLDGHTLSVKFAKRGQDAEELEGSSAGVGGKSKSATTKILVKNLPFEATKRDVRELFGSQGELKSVRLPKRMDSRTRGFAFVEYVSRREAEAAFQNLKHTHLLGRHLVLQWSDTPDGGNLQGEEELEQARRKTGLGFVGSKQDGRQSEVAGKKGKMKLGQEDIAKAIAAERKKSATAEDDSDDD